MTCSSTAWALFLIIFIGYACGEPYGSRSYGGILGSQDAIEEHDLLQAIRVPFDDPRTQYFEAGLDGFPAYGLRDGAEVKSHYRLFLPDRLYRDFALLATVKPERRESAFLFAVVNPLDTIVQFGLKIPAPPNISPSLTSSHHMISLLYTDVGSHLVTQTLVSFEVPLMTRRWNRFALKIIGDNVTLFLNCREHSSKLAMRNPKELSFDPASTLYVGQAGPILKGSFQVSRNFLFCHDKPHQYQHQLGFWYAKIYSLKDLDIYFITRKLILFQKPHAYLRTKSKFAQVVLRHAQALGSRWCLKLSPSSFLRVKLGFKTLKLGLCLFCSEVVHVLELVSPYDPDVSQQSELLLFKILQLSLFIFQGIELCKRTRENSWRLQKGIKCHVRILRILAVLPKHGLYIPQNFKGIKPHNDLFLGILLDCR
ncbi:Collagen alpha-1(XV) chain [Orchesella cincta]|uniref:Collagen alpha-1(XV) chain n=1 Tax=Orchesella cincta TaxID=48709 RepID=A0A1D2MX85_ORCCI|nr:Collagen alpha-1(XV) chain [Orchesella cincta]